MPPVVRSGAKQWICEAGLRQSANRSVCFGWSRFYQGALMTHLFLRTTGAAARTRCWLGIVVIWECAQSM
jgi:hypothetical protein